MSYLDKQKPQSLVNMVMINFTYLAKRIAASCPVRLNEECGEEENDTVTAACETICFSNMTQFEQVISFEKCDVFKVKMTLKIQKTFERQLRTILICKK